MADKKKNPPKLGKGIPVPSKIPITGHDSGTHSRSSSVSNLTAASDLHSEAGGSCLDISHDFKVDDRVWVNGTKSGCIKFLGKAEFAPGSWAGILLDECVGKNDGSVDGVKYFSCEPMKGIFARPQKLSRTPGPFGDAGTTTPKASVPSRATTPLTRGVPPSTPTSSRTCSRIRVGERVVVNSNTGNKSGILRFLGEADFAKGEWAGIELDDPVGKNDGSVAGKKYFQCPMKYGLFAPVHKIAREGGVATPASSRAGSVRGTPLMRSVSRDSLSSSISSSSKTSRVKLGVTSLANTQKTRTSGMGLITNSKALEEVIKEKDQHIEQLLKEQNFARAEVAQIASHKEQLERRMSDLESQLKITEQDKENIEQERSSDKKHLEDLQFQLEEESILKSELESQLKQKNKISKRLQDFLTEHQDIKYLNINEILEEKEILSICSSSVDSQDVSEPLKNKVKDLENQLKSIITEKEKAVEESKTLQSTFQEIEGKNENLVKSLRNAIQERDEINTNLRNELNCQVEKLTKLMEDNSTLNEQINSQAVEAQNNTDSVVKEFGEKLKMYVALSDELKTKCNQLDGFIQEKDTKFESLQMDLEKMTLEVTTFKKLNQELREVIELNKSELSGKAASLKTSEEELKSKNTEFLSEINKKEVMILDLNKSIKDLSSSVIEKEEELSRKQENISSMQSKIDELTSSLSEEIQKFVLVSEKISQIKEDNLQKVSSLQEELKALHEENDNLKNNFEKTLEIEVDKNKALTQELESKAMELDEKQSDVSLLNESLSEKNIENSKIHTDMEDIRKQYDEILQQKENLLNAIKSKEELIHKTDEELLSAKQTLESRDAEIKEYMKQKESLDSTIDGKAEENLKLGSELQLAKQTIDNLNKSNSDLSLEFKNQIFKQKDEYDQAKDNLEKSIVKLEKELKDSTNKICTKEAEILALKEALGSIEKTLHQRELDIEQHVSMLQLAEQKVEMLNKDSSEHLKLLQHELTKVKEESVNVKVSLEEVVSDLKKQLTNMKMERDDNGSQLSESKKEILSLEETIKLKNDEINQLCSKLTSSEQNIELLNQSGSEQVHTLQEEITKLKEESQNRENLLKKELEIITKEKDSLVLDIQQRNSVLNEKQNELSELENKAKNFQLRADALNSDIEKLNDQIISLIKEKDEMQLSNQNQLSSERKNNDTELQMKDKIIAESQVKLSEHISELEVKSQTLLEKVKELEELKSTIREQESQIEKLSTKLENSTSDLNKHIAQNATKEKLLESKEEFIIQLKAENKEKLQEKEESFQKNVKDLESIIEQSKSLLLEKEAVIFNLTSEKEEQNTKLKSLDLKIKETQSNFEKNLSSSDNVQKELLTKCSTLEEVNETLLKERNAFSEELKNLTQEKSKIDEIRNVLLADSEKHALVLKEQENQLKSLQAELLQKQAEVDSQKQQLKKKSEASESEIQESAQLKKELSNQHCILEEMKQKLLNSDEKCKDFEKILMDNATISKENSQLLSKLGIYENNEKEQSKKVLDIKAKNEELDDMLKNHQIMLTVRESEISSLNAKLEILLMNNDSVSNLKSSLESLSAENALLKQEIQVLSSSKNLNANVTENNNSNPSDEDKEFLNNQIDFLNSIIADLKQKNEDLKAQLELQMLNPGDSNLNEIPKKKAPRLFCDICDMFDLHDTEDCPKQESFIDEEAIPSLVPQGVRTFEERPYCNNCEIFGHWTLDCQEEETY